MPHPPPPARLLVALFGVALAQCSVLPPYETSPAAPAKGRPDPSSRVAVCYNSLTTNAAAVRAIAANACDPGTTPKPVDHDMSMSNCPLFEPLRATFSCIKPASPAAGEP